MMIRALLTVSSRVPATTSCLRQRLQLPCAALVTFAVASAANMDVPGNLADCSAIQFACAAESNIVLKVPPKRTLGQLVWLPPGQQPVWDDKYLQPHSPPWHKYGSAEGNVTVPKGALLVLEVSFDATQDPTLLTAYGPSCFAGLRFHNVDNDDSTISKLSTLSGLRALELRESDITDEGLKSINKLKNLEFLNLAYTTVTAKGLYNLKDLHGLKHLVLDATAISGKDFKVLDQFKQLRSCTFDHCRLTDEDLQVLANLPEVRTIGLDSDKHITATGLLTLSRLKNLAALDIQRTGVTASDLKTIKKLVDDIPSLRAMALCDPSFTDEQQAIWKRALPQITTLHFANVHSTGGVDSKDIPKLFAPLHSWSERSKQ